MKSWKTTLGGFLAAVSLLIAAAMPLLDNDPTTVFSTEGALAAVTAVGIAVHAWFSRDKNVSSEDEGAK